MSALDAAGFDRTQPAVWSLFGVILYLTLDATRTTLRQLATTLAPQSEVTLTYNPPPDGTDPVAAETFEKASPRVDTTGESFTGFYCQSEIDRLAREAGFSEIIHYPLSMLNARYFHGRPDHLRLHSVELLLTAVV